MLHIKNPLGRDRQGKNQPIKKQIRRGAQGTLSLILQRNVGKITSSRQGYFECAAWLLSQEQRHRSVTTKKSGCTEVACVASVFVRFRSKEQGVRVKDREKNWLPLPPLSLLRNQTKTPATQASTEAVSSNIATFLVLLRPWLDVSS